MPPQPEAAAPALSDHERNLLKGCFDLPAQVLRWGEQDIPAAAAFNLALGWASKVQNRDNAEFRGALGTLVRNWSEAVRQERDPQRRGELARQLVASLSNHAHLVPPESVRHVVDVVYAAVESIGKARNFDLIDKAFDVQRLLHGVAPEDETLQGLTVHLAGLALDHGARAMPSLARGCLCAIGSLPETDQKLQMLNACFTHCFNALESGPQRAWDLVCPALVAALPAWPPARQAAILLQMNRCFEPIARRLPQDTPFFREALEAVWNRPEVQFDRPAVAQEASDLFARAEDRYKYHSLVLAAAPDMTQESLVRSAAQFIRRCAGTLAHVLEKPHLPSRKADMAYAVGHLTHAAALIDRLQGDANAKARESLQTTWVNELRDLPGNDPATFSMVMGTFTEDLRCSQDPEGSPFLGFALHALSTARPTPRRDYAELTQA